jgi:Cu(I)-responsive transcriptional regulator
MARALTIGPVAEAAGCKVQTVRYYEQIGLLPPPARTQGNQRVYGEAHMKRLAFIRHARELGFSLESIRDLLSLADEPNRPCDAADAIAQAQLEEVAKRLGRLQALKSELERMLAQCRGGRIADCRVIEVLADHSHGHCLHDGHSAPAET